MQCALMSAGLGLHERMYRGDAKGCTSMELCRQARLNCCSRLAPAYLRLVSVPSAACIIIIPLRCLQGWSFRLFHGDGPRVVVDAGI
jgi:hypothetical protein